MKTLIFKIKISWRYRLEGVKWPVKLNDHMTIMYHMLLAVRPDLLNILLCAPFFFSALFSHLSILVELPWSQLDNLIRTSMEEVKTSFPKLIKSYSLSHPIKFQETESRIWLWIWVSIAIAIMLILLAVTVIVCIKWTKHKHTFKDEEPESPKKGTKGNVYPEPWLLFLDPCPGIENPGFVLPNMTIPKAKRATLSDEDFEITNF